MAGIRSLLARWMGGARPPVTKATMTVGDSLVASATVADSLVSSATVADSLVASATVTDS